MKILLNQNWLYLFFIFCLHISFGQQNDANENLTEISVNTESEIKLDGSKIEMDSLASKINSKLKNYQKEDLALQTADIVVSSNTTEHFIEAIKKEVQKTPIQFTNVQRSIVANFSESGPVTDEMIEQYNILIEGWNQLEEEERYYRKIELNYVENIHQRMTFQQQINAKKLPGYLYFVKEPNVKEDISIQDLERWRFDDAYEVYINKAQIEKGILRAKSTDSFKGYYILRYLVNEEPFYEVYLFTK